MFQHKRIQSNSSTAILMFLLFLASLLIPSSLLAATLPAPSLKAAVQSGPQVNLSWQQPKAVISGFQIQRSLDPVSGFATIKTVAKTVLTATDSAVQAGTGYYYRVRSYKTGTTTSYSAFSNVVFADVPPAVSVDSIPPSVSITTPTPGSQFLSVQTVSITAVAQDNVAVSKVEFYGDGVLKKTATAAPYKHDWALSEADNGSHSFTAKAYDTAGNVSSSAAVSVAVNVDSNPPTVSITSPVSGASYASAQTVSITASAQDNVGVSKVEFYDGATLKGTATVAPYAYAWAISSADNGSHSFTAKAYDAAGNVASSAAVSVAVNIPVVAAPGSFEFAVSNYSVRENAGKVDITIKRVGGSDGIATVDWRTKSVTANYDLDYIGFALTTLTFASGESSKLLSVSILDDVLVEGNETFNLLLANPTGGAALGAIVTSAVVVVDNDTDSTPPTVSITSPASGTAYTSAQTVSITAAAQDNVGVSKVEFYDGGTLKSTVTAAPYTYAWAVSAAVNGAHSFVAKAYDAAGNVASSAALSVTVNVVVDNTPPTVSITSPASGTSYASAKTVSIAAAAQDNVGVSKVEFYDGSVLKGTATVAPYACAWTISSADNGSHSFTAKAYDAAGNVASSASVSLSVNIPAPVVGPLKVFPGAVGFGTDTPAGRGGQIIKVTNLNDSGAGSLRAAIAATGPRIIVFEVGGVINLLSDLNLINGNCTIAGQTAPGSGIMLRGYGLKISGSDILVQHIAIRYGDDGRTATGAWDNADCLQITGNGSHNIVIDHVSLSWAIDENASVYASNAHDITFSHNIIAEGLANSAHTDGAHSKGLLVAGGGNNPQNIAIINNLLAHNTDRNPQLKGGTSSVVSNNVMYNAGDTYASSNMTTNLQDNTTVVIKASYHGNVFKDGPQSAAGCYAIKAETNLLAGSQFYASDNVNLSRPNYLIKDNNGYRVNTPPVVIPDYTPMPYSQTMAYVLANAGSRPAQRDSVDSRIIGEVQSGTGSRKDHSASLWPTYAQASKSFTVPLNPNGDDDQDGYTNIEELLHQMAAQVEGRVTKEISSSKE